MPHLRTQCQRTRSRLQKNFQFRHRLLWVICQTVHKAEIAAISGRRPVLRMAGKGLSCAAISSDRLILQGLVVISVRLRPEVRKDLKGNFLAAINNALPIIPGRMENFVCLHPMADEINAAMGRPRGVDLGAGQGVVLVD